MRVYPSDAASRQQEVAEERSQNDSHLTKILPRSHQPLFQAHAGEEIRSGRTAGDIWFLLIGSIFILYIII